MITVWWQPSDTSRLWVCFPSVCSTVIIIELVSNCMFIVSEALQDKWPCKRYVLYWCHSGLTVYCVFPLIGDCYSVLFLLVGPH